MIENVTQGVKWIPGRDRFLPDSHMYVIGIAEFKDYTLVDCGLMEMGAYKIEAIENSGIRLDDVKRIVMTHTHMDHIGCLPELLEVLPHVEVWVHKEEALYLERGDDRIVYGNSMFESMLKAQYRLEKDYFRIKAIESFKAEKH